MEHNWSRAKKRRIIWGVGGTILSAFGFVALAMFEQYNGMVSELRADLKHFNETSSEYVKKDTLQRIRDRFRDSMKELQEANAARARMEQELQASEKAREVMFQEIQRMRERLAYVEGRQTPPDGGLLPTAKNLKPNAN
jgi:chromosome segregation ATPase